MDRSAIYQALSKALAYAQAGKRDEAEQWARKLVILLKLQNILKD